jgi:glutamine amidotransferase
VSDYGTAFSAALSIGNFFGVQFHPERSGDVGERIIENFLNM